jgi:hypothetical protein
MEEIFQLTNLNDQSDLKNTANLCHLNYTRMYHLVDRKISIYLSHRNNRVLLSNYIVSSNEEKARQLLGTAGLSRTFYISFSDI